MKIALISFLNPSGWIENCIGEYDQKINHFIKLELCFLKSDKKSRQQKSDKKEAESALLIKQLTSDDYVILLDEKGKFFGSIEWSKKIQSAMSSSKKRLVFIIGGAFGVSDDIKKRAHITLSLSELTMNQNIAHAVFLEQLYRSMTIIHHFPYHND